MDRICRLCFAVSDQEVFKPTKDSDIISLLHSCLRLELSLIEDFPKQVCEDCHSKIQNIHSFHMKVIENELKLIDYLNKNSLQTFYSQLTNKVGIKEEPTINSVKEECCQDQTESQDSNHSESTSYYEPNCSEVKKKTETKENGTSNGKRKARTREESIKKTRSPKVKRRVIKNDQYADHDPNKCLTCFKLCNSSINLSNHYKNEHSIPPGSIKPENDIDITDKYNLHKLEGQKPLYKCNSCGESHEDVAEIIKHVVLHLYERPYICKLCGKTYKTVYEIVRHGKVHSGFKLFCQHGCGYSSPYAGAMRDHEKRHTDDRNYTCKTCGKGFLVKTWYDQHQNIHNKVKPFVCDICGMAFHMHRYLVTHRNKKHPGLSAIRKYICTQCSFTCDNKNGLTTHMEEHAENPAEAKLTLLCDICGKGFARTDHLANHKNGKHYGIKPYSCSFCDKQFQKKFNLTVHERIHTGEGRHLCLHCGKLFAQKSTLHRHQKKRHPEEYGRGKESSPSV